MFVRTSRAVTALSATVLAALLPQIALAHPAPSGGGFLAGLNHPLHGADHLLAVLAVGLWAGQLGRPVAWALPAAFIAFMGLGAAVAIGGVAVPGGEWGVALSVAVLGALISADRRLAMPAAMAVASVFALAHGHAHGSALPAHADPVFYGLGFTIATVVVQMSGVALGIIAASPARRQLLRAGGVAMTLAGIFIALSQLAAFSM